MAIAPPPVTSEAGSFAWLDWYSRLSVYLNTSNSIPWTVVNKAGSKLTDLATRTHANLQSVAGSVDQYHVSAAQYAALGTSYVNSFNTRTGVVTLSSSDVTTALTFTPYNATNPNAYISSSGAPVQSVAGKTGTVSLVKGDVGLGNVDNTSDVSKPVSTAQATSIATKAALAGSSGQDFAANNITAATSIAIAGTNQIYVNGAGSGDYFQGLGAGTARFVIGSGAVLNFTGALVTANVPFKGASTFACNNATPQAAAASGGAAPAGGTGTAAGGWDTAAHRDSAITLLNNIRTALINNGIMS